MAEATAAQRSPGIGAKYNFSAAGGGIVAFAQGDVVPYPDGKVGEGPGEAFTPEEMYAGEHRQTPLPPTAQPAGPMSAGLKNVTSYMDQLKAMGYGQPTQYELEQRAQIAKERADAEKGHENNLGLALLAGAGKGLQNTSPFAGPGIGAALETGVGAYNKGNADYDTQLKALRAGELDLSKLNATDRNNLLHYAMSGATAEQVAQDAAAARVEAQKLRMATIAAQNAQRLDNKDATTFNTIYSNLMKAAKNPITGAFMPGQSEDTVMQTALSQLAAYKNRGTTDSTEGSKTPPPPPGFVVPGTSS
jgi:hypothetical protein